MRRQYAGRPRKRYYRRRIRFMSPLFILLCALCVGLIVWGVTALVRRPAQDVPDAKKTADYSNTFLPGVTVNGETCTQRGRKLRPGDVVDAGGRRLRVIRKAVYED